ncbi:hypothetical protein J6590_032289 [Homalodisca vitripennis]|nr:hypothetical protein J6590_032289 [Homalodisca vitripennis]
MNIFSVEAMVTNQMTYGIALQGGSSCSNFERVLLIQKRVIRAMVGLGFRESCRQTFREWEILSVVSSYKSAAVVVACTSNSPKIPLYLYTSTKPAMRMTSTILPIASAVCEEAFLRRFQILRSPFR